MTATKDQKKLLSRCLLNEIPVFVLTGTDACAIAALKAYIQEARNQGCPDEFIQDLETNILPDFKDFQEQEPELVKKPD
jgi:hypothetical protein